MVKYNDEFKQKVVNAYLAGEGGYVSIAKRFSIPSKVTVKKWVNAFKRFGKEGLVRRQINKTYPVQFKLDVLHYKLRTGESYQDVALKFGLREPPMIANWLKKWQSEDIEGLSKPKGRPPVSNKSKKKSTAKKLTNEQQLKKENELLRAENAYLKKLRASGINIPSRLLERNQESSTNSEKSSN